MSNAVSVLSLDKRFVKHKKHLRKEAINVLGFLKKDNIGIDIYLIGNVRMRYLNKKYIGKDNPTNVLAFPSPQNFPDPSLNIQSIGEVYLNVPYIKREHESMGYFLVHGILHLLGFNHLNKSDRIKMENLESKIMQWLKHIH